VRPIAPRTGAHEITYAEEQEDYMPLTVAIHPHTDGSRSLLTRWTLTPDERRLVAAGEDIYIAQLNFGGPMAPLVVRCGPAEYAAEPQPGT
jgi:hypothetical protein